MAISPNTPGPVSLVLLSLPVPLMEVSMHVAAESPSPWHGGSLGLLARGQVGVGGCKFPCSALGAGDVFLPKAMPRVRTARNFPFLLCLWILTLFHLVIGVLGSPSWCGASMSTGTIQTLCLWEAEGKNSILGSSMAEALHPRAETAPSSTTRFPFLQPQHHHQLLWAVSSPYARMSQ